MRKTLMILALLTSSGLLARTSAQVLFVAKMDGSQENPPVVSNGQGAVWAVLSADRKTLTYRVTYAHLNSARTIGHFHTLPGTNVVQAFTFNGNTASGTWSNLPDSIVYHLFKGDVYANVHSSTSPGGEIRGFMQPVQGEGFTVAMDGSQENPPNSSTATGTGWVVLDSASARLTYNVTIAGINDTLTAGHFHTLPGGNVVHPITFVDSTSSGTWSPLPDTLLAHLLKGDLYINAHGKQFPAGEIRGFVLSSPGGVTAVQVSSPGVPSVFSLEQNYPNPFNPSTKIQFSLAKASVVTLKVYNVLGQQVASLLNERKEAGTYEVTFNAGGFASGVYFYRLSTPAGVFDTRKMMLLK